MPLVPEHVKELEAKIKRGEVTELTDDMTEGLSKMDKFQLKGALVAAKVDRKGKAFEANYTEKKANKKPGIWQYFLATVGVIWVILAIPVALTVVGIPFAILMLLIGGYGIKQAFPRK